jgi:hypothetical protein
LGSGFLLTRPLEEQVYSTMMRERPYSSVKRTVLQKPTRINDCSFINMLPFLQAENGTGKLSPNNSILFQKSFFSLNGDFNAGVFDVFGTGSGDQLNPFFIPQDQTGEVRVAHPSFATDIEAGDDRINKATLRNPVASLDGLSSNRDIWVYTSSTAPIPIIRNEELILIFAEANIQNNDLSEGTDAINAIRNGHNLPNYSGANTQAALLTEMLNQRRYSLFCEGHRWIDLRRYNLLNTLPIDRTGDQVWTEFPLPVSEQ